MCELQKPLKAMILYNKFVHLYKDKLSPLFSKDNLFSLSWEIKAAIHYFREYFRGLILEYS